MVKQPQGTLYRGSMKKIAVALPIALFDWVARQAERNKRTFSQEITECVSTTKLMVEESDTYEPN